MSICSIATDNLTYKLIAANSLEQLAKKLEPLLRQGYQPHDSVLYQVTSTYDANYKGIVYLYTTTLTKPTGC